MGGTALFIVLEDGGPLHAGNELRGRIELRSDCDIRACSVALVFRIGFDSTEACAMDDPFQFLDLTPEIRDGAGCVPFRLVLPLAPVYCTDPLALQPSIVARATFSDHATISDRVPLLVRTAPQELLHSRDDDDPYRAGAPSGMPLSTFGALRIQRLLTGKPGARTILDAFRDSASIPKEIIAPEVAAMGELIRVRELSDSHEAWVTLCCRLHRSPAEAGEVVCRVEPRDVIDRSSQNPSRSFVLQVPPDGPPSFVMGSAAVQWSVVLERSSGEVESPLVVLPFRDPNPAVLAPANASKGKLARALRRIRAAKDRG